MRKSLLSVLGTASMLLLAGFGCDSSYVQKIMPPAPPMEPTISSPDGQMRLGGAVVSFGQEMVMSLHTKVGYRDGLVMEVISITDTRCPKDEKCDKPGAATVTVRLFGGDVGAIPQDVSVVLPGQVSAKQYGYILFVSAATKTTAALTLSKQQPPKPKPNAPPIPPGPPKEIQN